MPLQTRRTVLRAFAGAAAVTDKSAVATLKVTGGRILTCDTLAVSCIVGRTGVSHAKHEGDGATPAGSFPLRRLLYRPDKMSAPTTMLPSSPMTPTDGWCDDPADPAYNEMVHLPYRASHEELWRPDELYDVLVVIGYNDAPVLPGLGSAIFLHVARPGMTGTDGCVGLLMPDLLKVVSQCGVGTVIDIS
jgi:L,D-peptidoglycan transpeptidase YkuD (ErfK/YbiS/YcfS/YnhG family)